MANDLETFEGHCITFEKEKNYIISAPELSFLNMIANYYKLWCFQFLHMQHIFIKTFGYFTPSVNCDLNSQVFAGKHQHKYTNQQYYACISKEIYSVKKY